MDKELVKDYTSYIASSAITLEVSIMCVSFLFVIIDHISVFQQAEPIHTSIEQMLNRLEEFESILSTVR